MASVRFDNWEDMEKELNKRISKVLQDEILPEGVKVFKQETKNRIYDRYKTESRTNDLQNSITQTKVKRTPQGLFMGHVWHNPNMAHHTSILTGQHIDVNMLSRWKNDGNIHNVFHVKPETDFLRPSRHIDATCDKIEKQWDNMVTKSFRKQGMNIHK